MATSQELPKLKTLPSTATAEQIIEMVDLDGAVIVEDVLDPLTLEKFNAEIDSWIANMDAGARYSDDPQAMAALGKKTKRIQSLPARSDTAVGIILNERFIEYAERMLKYSDSGEIQYHNGTVIEIWPGETPQYLHPDENDYPSTITGPFESPGKPRNLIANCMFALTDYTEENGATRVIPGSHKDTENWGRWAELPEKPATIAAEMKAGSALFYNGKVAHGGGENLSDKPRRGMSIIFSQGWLKPMEASCLATSLERARQLPKKMQQLIGFSSYHRPLVSNRDPNDYTNLPEPRSLLWHVDVGDASYVLKNGPIA